MMKIEWVVYQWMLKVAKGFGAGDEVIKREKPLSYPLIYPNPATIPGTHPFTSGSLPNKGYDYMKPPYCPKETRGTWSVWESGEILNF
jgi:hypothetical protein